MRAALLALVLALAGANAAAQLIMPDGKINTACEPTPRDPPLAVPAFVAPVDLPTQAEVRVAAGVPAPSQLPSQIGGSGTKALIDFNAKGVAIGWWVPKVGKVDLHLHGVTWGHLMANPGLAARLAWLAVVPNRDSAMVAAIGNAYAPTLHILDMCDVWNPIAAALNAIKPAALPPPPAPGTWATIGGSIFTSNGTILTGVTPRKVAPGLVCRTDVPPVKSGATRTFYPLVGGAANERVECRSSTPTSSIQELADQIRASLERQRVLLADASAALAAARAIIAP